MYDSKQNIDVLGQFCAEVCTCTWCFYPYKKCSCRVMKKITIKFHRGALIIILFWQFFSLMAFSSFNLSQSLPVLGGGGGGGGLHPPTSGGRGERGGAGGGGGEGVLRISGDKDDRVGAKINRPKIPRASNKTPKKLWTKIKPPKNPMPNFGATKISRKHEDITWN